MGSGPRRRLRGSVAQPPGRGARTAARRPGRALRRVRDAAEGARRPRVPARRRAARVHGGGARNVRSKRRSDDGELHELVIRHELQHTETMLQAMTLAGILPPSFGGPRAVSGTGLEMVEVTEGPFELGAAGRRASPTTTSARATARPPSASRSAARRSPTPPGSHFAEGGGYERREWWSDEGWAWKEQYDITHHARPGRGSGRARRPRLLVRGRRLRPRPRGAPADGDRVGEGGDLGPARGGRARSGSGP